MRVTHPTALFRLVMFAKRADDAVVRWSAVPRPPHWTGPPLRAPSVIFSAKFAASSNLPLIALARFSSTAAIRLKTHIKMPWAAINSAAIRLVSVSISNGSSLLHSTRQIPRSSLRRALVLSRGWVAFMARKSRRGFYREGLSPPHARVRHPAGMRISSRRCAGRNAEPIAGVANKTCRRGERPLFRPVNSERRMQ